MKKEIWQKNLFIKYIKSKGSQKDIKLDNSLIDNRETILIG